MADLPQLAYDRSGSGEPLVLIHPLGGDRGVWEPVMPELAREHDVIAIDMPGFGESPLLGPGLPPTAVNLAAAVETTVLGLGIERFHIVGNSLGGWTALELARSEGALSVTGLCPAGFWARVLGPRPEVARKGAKLIVPLLGPLMRSRRGRGIALAATTAHPERVPPAAAERLVRSYGLSPGFEIANAEMRKTLFAGFDDIDVPITLAWGERDRLVTKPAHLPEKVHSVVLGDCGHVPMWDDPRQVIDVIRANIARAAEVDAA